LEASGLAGDRLAWDDVLHERRELTEDGRAVLAGGLDAIELRGIDRWLGGTHLKLPDAVWRWDPGTGAVVGP
jgi:hypothetical protein